MQVEVLPCWLTLIEAAAWAATRDLDVVRELIRGSVLHTSKLASEITAPDTAYSEPDQASHLPVKAALEQLETAMQEGAVRARATWEGGLEWRDIDETDRLHAIRSTQWRHVRVFRDDILKRWPASDQQTENVIPPGSGGAEDIAFIGLDTAIARMELLGFPLETAQRNLLQAFISGDLDSRLCKDGFCRATVRDARISPKDWLQGGFRVDLYRANKRKGPPYYAEVSVLELHTLNHYPLCVVAIDAAAFMYWLDNEVHIAPASVGARSGASSVEATLDRTSTGVQAERTRGTKDIRSGFAGRPTSMHLVKQELERRRQARETLSSQAKEAAHLSEWLSKVHPGMPPAKAKTISNSLGDKLRAAKSDVHSE